MTALPECDISSLPNIRPRGKLDSIPSFMRSPQVPSPLPAQLEGLDIRAAGATAAIVDRLRSLHLEQQTCTPKNGLAHLLLGAHALALRLASDHETGHQGRTSFRVVTPGSYMLALFARELKNNALAETLGQEQNPTLLHFEPYGNPGHIRVTHLRRRVMIDLHTDHDYINVHAQGSDVVGEGDVSQNPAAVAAFSKDAIRLAALMLQEFASAQ